MLRSLLPHNLGKPLSELYKSEAAANDTGNKKDVVDSSAKKTNKIEMNEGNTKQESDYENIVPTDKLEDAPKTKWSNSILLFCT